MMKNKMKIYLAWLLAACTLLSACATSPDISRTLRFRGKHVDDVFQSVVHVLWAVERVDEGAMVLLGWYETRGTVSIIVNSI